MPEHPPARAAPRSGSLRPGRATARPRVGTGRLLVVAAIAVWLVGPTAARSDSGPNFGTLGLGQTRFGGVVSIVTPSAGLFQAPDEFVVEREVVQSSNSDPGLIQAGIYRSGGGVQLDGCGPPAGYVVFTEVKVANSMSYRCQLFNAVSPGTVLTLDIFRFKSPATWGIRINGVPTGSVYQLGFNRGQPAVGSEIQSASNSYRSQTSTRFEPAGHAQWAVYTKLGRRHRRRVTRRDSLSAYPMLDHLWRLTRPPSAITIKHRVP